MFNINNRTIKKLGKKLIKKSKQLNSDYVSSFGTPYGLYPFDKSIYSSYTKSKFESLEVNGL